MHAGTIRIEDADNTNIDFMLAVIVKEQCFSRAFAFIITGPHPDRIDIAMIVFRLWMHGRVAINFRCGGLENFRPGPLGQTQHIDRAMNAGFQRLDRIMLIVNRACRTGQIINLVNLEKNRHGHIMANKLKIGIGEEMGDIIFLATEKIIHADHICALRQQRLAEVRPQKAGPACYQNTSSEMFH